MEQQYLDGINKKETNELLVSLRLYAEEHKVPIITAEGIVFMNQIIALRNVKRVLEIGTAIGYSALNMVLNSNVDVVTIERDADMYNIALKNIENAGLSDKIKVINADLTDSKSFDLLEKDYDFYIFKVYKVIIFEVVSILIY